MTTPFTDKVLAHLERRIAEQRDLELTAFWVDYLDADGCFCACCQRATAAARGPAEAQA